MMALLGLVAILAAVGACLAMFADRPRLRSDLNMVAGVSFGGRAVGHFWREDYGTSVWAAILAGCFIWLSWHALPRVRRVVITVSTGDKP
jgi:hypothetical protein